jgi:hypothetical protein
MFRYNRNADPLHASHSKVIFSYIKCSFRKPDYLTFATLGLFFSLADLLFANFPFALLSLSALIKSLIDLLSAAVSGFGSTTKSTSSGSLTSPILFIFKILINQFQTCFRIKNHFVAAKMDGSQCIYVVFNEFCLCCKRHIPIATPLKR